MDEKTQLIIAFTIELTLLIKTKAVNSSQGAIRLREVMLKSPWEGSVITREVAQAIYEQTTRKIEKSY